VGRCDDEGDGHTRTRAALQNSPHRHNFPQMESKDLLLLLLVLRGGLSKVA